MALDSTYIIGSPRLIIHAIATGSGVLEDDGSDMEGVKHRPVTG